ncbi:MAG: CRISPR-associated protein Cas5 [Thermoproteota archaeon]|nr:CRISPR-associated protein Cas5 [Thermoproteota archaeon]
MSFNIEGDFAAFRDPSVTTNQIVYYIPSKSSILGIIGSIMGIKRSHSFEHQFSECYLDLLRQTLIGLELLSKPNKITFYTNHRSFNEPKTKPFKKEVLEFPNYRVYVYTNRDNIINDLFERIKKNNFEYYPYFGHAYCPARITAPIKYPVFIENKIEDKYKFKTSSVMIDEINDETENNKNTFQIRPTEDDSSLIIERHLHHFFKNSELQKRVLKFWIPLNSKYIVTMFAKPELSKVVGLNNDTTICLF